MNELRNPTSLLAGTNIVFSVGSFMFLYKRMEQLQNDNLEMKKTIQTLTSNMLKNNNDADQTKELIGKMYKDVKILKEDNLNEELKAIMDTLEDHNIDVIVPKKKKPKKKYSSSEESSEEEAPKRKPRRKTKEEEDEDIINMMRLKRTTY